MRSVRVSVASAFTSTLVISVEPPTVASRVSISAITFPPRGRMSRILNSDFSPVAANPSPIVTAITKTRYGTGHRVTLFPSTSANGAMPGRALEIGRGGVNLPRDSRCWSIIDLPAGINVSITIRLIPTPSPATIPKSPITPIGENKVANRLTIVVMAASVSGIVTFLSPFRTASKTCDPSSRCSR